MDDIYLRITENVTATKIKARITRCGNSARIARGGSPLFICRFF